MIRNTNQQWGVVAKWLHWLTVSFLIAEVPAGYLMSYTYGLSMRDPLQGLPLHRLAGQIHHTIGFTILLLVAARIVWRCCNETPQPLAKSPHVESRRPTGAGGRSALAAIIQGALYLVLIGMPLSGWAALSVYGDAPLWLFDRSDVMPRLLPRAPLNDPHGYGFYAKIHYRLLLTGLGLFALHSGAALWHHVVRRDDVLLRMWPLARPRLRGTPP